MYPHPTDHDDIRDPPRPALEPNQECLFCHNKEWIDGKSDRIKCLKKSDAVTLNRWAKINGWGEYPGNYMFNLKTNSCPNFRWK